MSAAPSLQRPAHGLPTCPPHHYLIESPKGPTSVGVCRKCNHTRVFENVLKNRYGYQINGASKFPPFTTEKPWIEGWAIYGADT